MSQADPPKVMQGRLGWESGDLSEADPRELDPHPDNERIYGDTEDTDQLEAEFLESVREKGVMEPLIVTEGKTIISGHRRQIAALECDHNSVPILYYDFEDEIAEREALIELNRQRDKSPAQIINEFDYQLDTEKLKAKGRQGERTDLKDGSEPLGNISEKSDRPIESREEAADKVNAPVSGRTLEKGLRVKQAAEDEQKAEEHGLDHREAREQWESLERSEASFSGAYDNAKDTTEDDESSGSDIEQFTSQKTDEWSSPRELVEPLAEAVGGFDLDPCSGAEDSPFAENTYTEDDDGLTSEWYGDVWVNPPYSAMSEWTEKAVDASRSDATDRILYLCKGDSSTQWWQDAIAEAECVLAIDGRLSFGDGENSAPFASHVFVFGGTGDDLKAALAEHGVVLEPWGGTDGD